ncbi:MAG: hypothetical protein A4E55_01192 [Pelotomaculum sp. PtaU1.Bin035]|nr:MAG: hypothetical protein A4E55_01192 [Pelotomaculum sp. PtaU1.Bin035]
MRRVLFLMILFSLITAGCSALQNPEASKKTLTEQDVRNAVTELVNGINNGNSEIVKKYVGSASPVADKLIEKLKGNIKLSDIRDVSIQGTKAQATVTLEVVPLKVTKNVTMNFDVTDVLLLNSPLGLLSLII